MFTKEKYLKYVLSLIPENEKLIINKDIVFKNSMSEFELINTRISDCSFGESYCKAINYTGAEPHMFNYKFVIFESVELVTSIRFIGKDKNKPFVQLEYIDNPFEIDTTLFKKLIKHILNIYRIFSVSKIRMFLNNIKLDSWRDREFTIDQLIYAIPITNIKSPTINNDIRFEKTTELSSVDYETYINDYNSYHRRYIEMSNIKPIPFSTLSLLFKEELCYKIYYKDEWAGISCFELSEDKFIYGVYVYEQCIFEKFKGKELASYSQKYIVSNYLNKYEGYLYGLIDGNNIASAISAKKVGRYAIAANIFIY